MLSFVSLLVHLFLAKSSANIVHYAGIPFISKSWSPFIPAENVKVPVNKKLWGKVKALEGLHPYAKPRSAYPVPIAENNGFIYAKIFGGFEKIRNAVCSDIPLLLACIFLYLFSSFPALIKLVTIKKYVRFVTWSLLQDF